MAKLKKLQKRQQAKRDCGAIINSTGLSTVCNISIMRVSMKTNCRQYILVLTQTSCFHVGG